MENSMDQARMSDTIEIEQLLAKYATGMTRDDVESVMEVFTADGWYAAFGEKYLLADFPTLVAAAPKGLFMTGTPALEFERGRGVRDPDDVLRRPDRPPSAHRVLDRHVPPYRGGLAPGHPLGHVPPQERGSRLRA